MLVKVGPRGQITIPKSVRTQLGINPGDSLAIVLTKDDEIVLQPVTETIFDLVGSISVPPGGPLSIEQLRESAVDYIVERVQEKDES